GGHDEAPPAGSDRRKTENLDEAIPGHGPPFFGRFPGKAFAPNLSARIRKCAQCGFVSDPESQSGDAFAANCALLDEARAKAPATSVRRGPASRLRRDTATALPELKP